MMTLTDAIKHCEDVANDRCGCAEDCVSEHRQLAEWLKELQSIVHCGECKKRKKNKFCLEHMRYEKDDDGFCSYGERAGRKEQTMKQITINPSNKPYYSEDFIKGFECGTQRQLEADKADIPKWIPCSERLPDYMVAVLTWDGMTYSVEKRIPYVTDEDGEHIMSEWWVSDDFDWWVSDDFDEENTEYYPNLRDGAAIAWMPLPEPWKGASR